MSQISSFSATNILLFYRFGNVNYFLYFLYMEEYRKIDDLLVSNEGNVKSEKGKLLNQYPTWNGYLRVQVHKGKTHKNLRVARLVAFAFPEICGEYFEGAEVNHKNCIITDNRACNLEWVDSRRIFQQPPATQRKIYSPYLLFLNIKLFLRRGFSH